MHSGHLLFSTALCLCGVARCGFAIGQPWYVQTQSAPGAFALAQGKTAANVDVDSSDWAGVIRAAGELKDDIARVTGAPTARGLGASTIIIGTPGRCPTIDRVVGEGKIDAKAIAGKWESFFLPVVSKPLPGVSSALVIAGGDKRGAIMASTIYPSRSAFRPGTGGRTCRSRIKTRCS